MLGDVDVWLFRAINERFTCGPLDWFGAALQSPWWLWPPLAIVLLWWFYRGTRQDRVYLIVAILTVALTDAICAQVLKPLIARPRPTVALEGVRLVVGYKSGSSMPSNHAANLAAVALLLGARYRRLIGPAVIAALVVGYTRVYVGVHYPLDVLVGYAVGLTMGLIGFALWEKLNRQAVERPVDKL